MPLFVVLRDGAELDDDARRRDPPARPRGLLAAARAERDPGDRRGAADAVGQGARGAGQADPDGRARPSAPQAATRSPTRRRSTTSSSSRASTRAFAASAAARAARPASGGASAAGSPRGPPCSTGSPAACAAARHCRWRLRTGPARDVQQRGAARVEPLAPQVRAQRVGPGEQQPGRDPGRRVAHERVVRGERRGERFVLGAAVADRGSEAVERAGHRREQHDGRGELQRAEQRPVRAGDARGGGADDRERAAASHHSPPGTRASRRASPPRGTSVRAASSSSTPPRARRRRDEHDLGRAPRQQPAQRPGAARRVEQRATARRWRRRPGRRPARRSRPARRWPPARSRARARRRVRADPVRLDPRLVAARPQVVVRPHREAALGVAAHGPRGRERGEAATSAIRVDSLTPARR